MYLKTRYIINLMSKTLNYTDIEHDSFKFTTFKNDIFMRYDNTTDLYIQSPWTNLYQYGIPRNDKYHKTNEARQYIQVPIDSTKDDSKQFGELFKHIDNLLNDTEFKLAHLGAKFEKYELSSCYKVSNNPEYADSVKFKFDTEYSEERALTTEVYKSSVKHDGTIVRRKCSYSSIDELNQLICFKSDIRFVFKISKIWRQPDSTRAPLYGATLKIAKIEFKEKANKGLKTCCFLDGVEAANLSDTLSQIIDAVHYDISSDDENGEQNAT